MLSLVWCNVLLLTEADQYRQRYKMRRAIAASFRVFLRTARLAGVLDYHIEGASLPPAKQGCLIVANHPTLIDYVLLASVMPDIDCLVKAELQHNPFIKGVIRAAGYLQNAQADTLIPEIQRRLAAGNNILLFPEGTRTHPGEPLRLLRGAANIALRTGCDLCVVHIRCSQSTLSKQNRWYHIPPEKPVFSVTVQPRITNENFITGLNDTAKNSADPGTIQILNARQLTRHLTQLLTPKNSHPVGNK